MFPRMNRTVVPTLAKMKPSPIAPRVLAWWDVNRRELPWRAPPGMRPDPYRVWLSEILLQQTTVQAVTPYFLKFIARWPRVDDLAAASLDEVMGAFAGLGYYSRARNLHACAQEVARRGEGFPQAEAALRALPGIGAYTAAAVAAIAFDEPAAPVDGNIARIIARLYAIDAPIVKARGQIPETAAMLTPRRRPGDFAQALMDIGAMICRPRNPECPACPMRADCSAARSGAPEDYPRRLAKKPKPLREGAAFFAERADGAILVKRRPPKGLLGGTLELPGTSWRVGAEPLDDLSVAPCVGAWRRVPGVVEQAFTHFSLRLIVFSARVHQADGLAPTHFWVARTDIETAGFSSLMRKAIAHALSSLDA
jgi:A/G-specific adenine glycosylase